MARLPRLALANHLHHVIHRGNNRQPIFHDTDDYARMHALLAQHARQLGVAVHAYALMPTQLHLLATPPTDDSLAVLMQAVGRSYVRGFNLRHGRTGSLWEGRYRSTVIEPESHLLESMAHIELQPVLHPLVATAPEWEWSSAAHNLGLRQDVLVKTHPLVWALGNTPFEREAAYAKVVDAGLSAARHEALSGAALHGWALGGPEFLANLERHSGRRPEKRMPGRPRTRNLAT